MKLGLGTVQFGMDYGISNKAGAVPLAEVRSILELAYKNGVRTLDTAAAYGLSEQALGAAKTSTQAFEIVTKTMPESKLSIEQSFQSSLEKLNTDSVYGLLVHDVEEVLDFKRGHEIMASLSKLKNSGLVKKIGASVYTADQIDRVLDRFSIDLIQVPLNVFDQRLIESGHLAKLKRAGIEVHIRSAFLQGLLLMSPTELPQYLSSVKDILKRLNLEAQDQGLSMLQVALRFVASHPEVDKVLVGVCSVGQLSEVLAAFVSTTDSNHQNIDFSKYAVKDESIINPALWGRST